MINKPLKSYTAPHTVKSLAIPLIALTQCLSTFAHADQNSTRDTIYFTLPPSPQVLASHLFGVIEAQPLTRSISFKKSESAATPVKERSVAMPILFHFGKTSVTEESKPFLDNIGKMLITPSNNDHTLIVEGHTDAVGSSEYNQMLSELRANAIKDYLVVNYGVNPDRLRPKGKGESALYNTSNPNSGENRRVEFLPNY